MRQLAFLSCLISPLFFVGRQMNRLREQARQVIKRSVCATEQDALIFTGSGCTSAIHTLIHILGLGRTAKGKHNKADHKPEEHNNSAQQQRPIVLVTAYEHHSNELPWRESVAEVITIPLDQRGVL